MPFASSNAVSLRFVEEGVLGVTPTNPQLDKVRYISESLNHNLTNEKSKEVRDDRMTSDLIQVKAEASGDIGFELSYGSFDSFIEGALASVFSTPLDLTASDISASDSDDSFNSVAAGFVNVVDGQWIKVSGFASSGNNGLFKVVSATTSKLIVLGSLTTEAAGPSVNVKASMIRNGVQLKSYTLQKFLSDATVPTYFNFRGSRVSSMSLDFQVSQVLTGSFGFMSLTSDAVTSQISGATTPDAPTGTPMNAVGNLSQILIDGAATGAEFSSISLSLDNSVRAQDAIGSLGHVGLALGQLQVSGGINLYFEDSSLYNKYLNATSFSLSFSVTDISGDSYVFTMPSVKFDTGKLVSGGLDSDMMLDTTYAAVADPLTDCMIQIDKL